MSPIQQMLLGVGAVATKTYIDDIFSNYLWLGTEATKTITNGIDLSGKGGLVWVKNRDAGWNHTWIDTERGANKSIYSDTTIAEATDSTALTSFNNNGFTVGASDYTNNDGEDQVSWTFRKSPGFCDVVTFTTSDPTISNRRISHNLGCVPGMIILKNRDDAEDWIVYHHSLGTDKYLRLSNSGNASTFSNIWGSSAPTSSDFGFNESGWTYANKDYVAYVFAGGIAGQTNSVLFDGTGDYLSLAASSDFTLDGDFTIEWFSHRGAAGGMSAFGIGNLQTLGGMEVFFHSSDGKVHIYTTDSSGGSNRLISTDTYDTGTFQHYALVRSGSTITLYFDGKSQGSWTESQTLGPSGNNTFTIGCSTGNSGASALWNGKISNFRITKGQALYTNNFNTPHDPLTQTSQNANSSNVKLLCCNGSSTTSSTVTPGTITANGDPTIDGNQGIFDDTAANVFGENEDQGVIKCGSYFGNENSNGPEIYLGWEPQWVMIKNVDDAKPWAMSDVMRGFISNGTGEDKYLLANFSSAEGSYETGEPTATGFKLRNTDGNWNWPDKYVYIAIRRPDGYCGKPIEDATKVFAMDTGNSSSTIPNFDSGFPVDFSFYKTTGSANDWITSSRLTSGKYVRTNGTDSESSLSSAVFDSNVGWNTNGNGATHQSWMWKRHAGFDVVAYIGNGLNNLVIPHSLGRTPEMMWVKNRTSANDWIVYHKGLNGGTNPQNYFIVLNSTSAEADNHTRWNDTAPTSTSFTLGDHVVVNEDDSEHIAMLFASVYGISKVGSYNGSTSNVTITTGFQPRFILIKGYNSLANGRHWIVMDSLRGFNPSGNTDSLYLEASSAQNVGGGEPYIAGISSTGFTLLAGKGDTNVQFEDGTYRQYIYYAHA